VGWAKALRAVPTVGETKTYSTQNTLKKIGGDAEFIIGRASARPGGFARLAQLTAHGFEAMEGRVFIKRRASFAAGG
jgi:hypothetical protein